MIGITLVLSHKLGIQLVLFHKLFDFSCMVEIEVDNAYN